MYVDIDKAIKMFNKTFEKCLMVKKNVLDDNHHRTEYLDIYIDGILVDSIRLTVSGYQTSIGYTEGDDDTLSYLYVRQEEYGELMEEFIYEW